MKTILFCAIILLAMSNGCSKKQDLMLADNEWKGILRPTLFIPAINEKLVYSKYCNKRLYGLNEFCYRTGSEILGYKITDSLTSYLKNRDDEPIENKLDTLYGFKFINDNELLEKEYLVFSKPFYIENDLVCFSIGLIGRKDKPLNQWVFFLKKDDNKYTLILLYDYLKDHYYKCSPLGWTCRPAAVDFCQWA
ncbi:MAG TPA: hypothetical protein VMW01_09370 [Williamwhitmania sp.]|nr:hypothetical protein [Williamwhitmania sp.]